MSFSSLATQAKAYADFFGVNVNPAILWDVIPFSFVLDWFLDVGGWLDSFKTKNLAASVCIEDFCYSVKQTGTSIFVTDQFVRTPIWSVPDVSKSSMKIATATSKLVTKTYVRKRCAPVSYILGLGGGLDKKRNFLSAALLCSR